MLKRLGIATVSFAVAAGAAATAQDPKQVEAGKKLYETYNCKKCHKIGGPSGKLQSLDGVATRLTPDEIHRWLVSPDEMTAKLKKKPVTKMKKQDFKLGEVEALMAFLSTLK
jgi:mono/diheme cytochrome c family protein